MVFIMETKICNNRMEKIRRKLGFSQGFDISADGSRGGLCLAWSNEISVEIRQFSHSFINVMTYGSSEAVEWRFIGFYGSSYEASRDESWRVLQQLSMDKSLSWFICGDFNEILYSHEM